MNLKISYNIYLYFMYLFSSFLHFHRSYTYELLFNTRSCVDQFGFPNFVISTIYKNLLSHASVVCGSVCNP